MKGQENSREPGELGFAVEEVIESRRSKLALVPYGLLSSSFHIMCRRALRQEVSRANGRRADGCSGCKRRYEALGVNLG